MASFPAITVEASTDGLFSSCGSGLTVTGSDIGLLIVLASSISHAICWAVTSFPLWSAAVKTGCQVPGAEASPIGAPASKTCTLTLGTSLSTGTICPHS